MAKPIIAVAIDMFSPAAYRAAAWPPELGSSPDFVEDYSHERDFAYVVLQPLLFRGAADVDEFPMAVTTDPAKYFARGQTLSAGDVAFADRIMAKKVPAGVEPVPVSLPPGTSIDLELVRGSDTLWKSGRREIGLTGSGDLPASPLVLKLNDWPPIASVNFAHPIATRFDELDAGQAEEVYVWLAAAVVDLICALRKGKTLTRAQDHALTIFALNDPPSTLEMMRDQLVGANRGAHMYDALLGDTEKQPSVWITPPRFKVVDPAAFERRIRAEIGNDLPPGASQASYLYVWWQTICRQAADPEAKDSWSNTGIASDLAAALGRYFGFGERLRWPKPPFDVASVTNEVFMVPRTKSTDGLFETNAASLCELVFRIPATALGGDIATLQANVSVASNMRDDAALPVTGRLGPQLAHVATLAAQWNTSARCRAVVRRDTADDAGQPMPDAHGIAMVQPRAAQCIPVDNPQAPGLFTVPGLLLELADNSPRHSLGDGGEGLVAEREPRRALFPEECLAFDTALLGATRWRIQGELSPAAVVTVPAKPTAPRIYEFIAAHLSHTPVQGVAAGAPATEADRFKQLLPELLVGGGIYRADLWMPNGAGVFRMEGRLLDADGPESDLRFYILDEDPSTGIGHAWPDTSKTGRNTVPADLVIEVVNGKPGTAAAQTSLPFNLVKYGADVPWVALNRSALSRVGHSVDRWLERFHVIPTVEGPVAADAPLRDHLLNFNKLRVFAGGEANAYVPVTYPDAAVPLRPAAPGAYAGSLPWEPSGGGWPSQPPFTYFVGHLYSQENATQRPDVGNPDRTQDRKPESLRYVRYARAKANEHVAGYVEHQYSYRIPIIQADWTADARIATDVRNPAALVAQSKGTVKSAGDAADTEGIKASFLELRFADAGKALLIAGRVEYFKCAFAAESELEKRQGDGRTPNVDTLRGIYEAIRDMKHAIEGGGAMLQANLFRFDNSLPRQGVSPVGNQSLPARLDRFVTGTLPLRADQGVGAELLAAVARLAPASYAEFENAIDTLRSSSNADVFAPIPVRMDDSDWSWQEAGHARQAPDLQLEANVVRLALDLHRPPEFVVDPESASGRLIPFTTSDAAIPRWIPDKIGDVLASARDELRSLLARPTAGEPGSSLYFRRDWLHAQPPEGNVDVEPAPASAAAPAKVESRAGRWRMIFGDYAPTLLVPQGEMRVVAQVTELFYVPVAFRPLATHPALATANDTLAFAEFLLRAGGDLLEGRAPEGILLSASPAGAAADGALGRLRLRELAEADAGIAATLLQLVSAVHNDADLRSHPDKLTRRALDLWDRSAPERKASLRALLSQSPQVFATARAIGTLLFDPARLARPLQSVQLWKRISQKIADPDKPIIDVDRFVIPPSPADKVPLLLDPLEAGRYDAEFELPMNIYRLASGDTATDAIYHAPIDLDQGVTLASRGGASGRSGEDFIESRHHFPLPEATSTERRAVEVDAPHWNPHWTYEISSADDTHKKRHLYLLPSRRFPGIPVPLQVASATPTPPGQQRLAVNLSAINLRTADAGSAKEVFRQTLRDSLRALDGLALVIRADGAEAAQQQATWSLDATTTAVVDDHNEADGWYRIDTFLEHHYFMVEAGETGEAPFANELFEIEVQVNRSGTAAASAALPTVAAPSAVLPSSPLLLAFRRWQQKTGHVPVDATPVPTTPVATEGITVPALVESIAHWLCAAAADPARVPPQERVARGNAALLRDVPPAAPDPTTVHFRAEYECSDPDHSLLVNVLQTSPDPLSQRIGSLVTVSMLKQTAAVAPMRGERAILRVSVLADPWSRLRVRMRQIRNRRDVDGGQPDIDPVFEMPSPYSSWSAYAHAEVAVDAPQSAASQVPASERKLDVTQVTLRDWLQRRAANPPPMIGKLVETRLKSRVPGKGPYAGKPYWNPHAMLDAQRLVSMVLRQRQPDRHMTHDGSTWAPVPARDLSVPRHVFGVIAANDIDEQLQAAAPKAVTAGEPELEITWLDKSSAGPVYRVTWPIRFTSIEV